MTLLLGAIADDFTGATDLANTLVRQGMSTIQVIGVPADNVVIENADAVVVALKSRTAPVRDAVRDSLAAADWLLDRGARQLIFKYCSTFDSTPRGNIGPVADALVERLQADLAVVCPAFPANSRTVYQGNLYVGDQLLAESPMRDHPLTPMTDSNLPRLMEAQSAYRCGLVEHDTVRRGVSAVVEAIKALQEMGFRYAVTDAQDDADLYCIGEAVAQHPLVTGGSGIALGLAENFLRTGLLGESSVAMNPRVEGGTVVLAGSCSEATRNQLRFIETRWPVLRLDVASIMKGANTTEEALKWYCRQDTGRPAVIYSSDEPDSVKDMQARYGRERCGDKIESVFHQLAIMLADQGVRRFVVAGGETSGAVVSALGISALRIGAEIDPGVPWTESTSDPKFALALKSGNFGSEEFFFKAMEMLI